MKTLGAGEFKVTVILAVAGWLSVVNIRANDRTQPQDKSGTPVRTRPTHYECIVPIL
jgi:hypothetical protein